MLKNVLSVLAAVSVCTLVSAQGGIDKVLRDVEINNLTLSAQNTLSVAQSLEARVGNSLPDPEVEFVHSLGRPSGIGKQGELTVTQEFDFPSAYALRNDLAGVKAEKYDNEYAAVRQGILLESKLLCLDIIALRQLIDVQSAVLFHSEQIEKIQRQRASSGDASALDCRQADMHMVSERNTLNLLKIELDRSLARLKALNGGKEVCFEDSLFVMPERLPDLQTLSRRWQTTSVSVRAALLEQKEAAAELRVSRSSSLPKFTLGYKHEFAAGERFHGVVAGVSIPMFGNRNNVKRSKAQAAYAEYAASASLCDVLSEVESLYGKAEVLSSAVESADSSEKEMEEYSGQLYKALEAGQIGLLEYFVQMNSVLSVRSESIEFRRDYLKTHAQLTAVDL